MQQVTIENITEVVESTMNADMNPRAREVLTSLVTHLHDFAREVNLTHAEWLVGIDCLTRAGAITDDKRNEFILLSDVLGFTSLVDAISHDATGPETESAVLGPFYREGAVELPRGATVSKRGTLDGPSTLVRGKVTDAHGTPVAGALIDVWMCAPNGLYEQQDDAQPDMNLRGKFRTATDGTYEFRAVRPVSYAIPDDGPAGDLLHVMGRHPYRPAHIHMMVSAPGFKRLVSQVYDKADTYIDSDAVYSVKRSLTVEVKPAPTDLEVDYLIDHDVVMKAETDRRHGDR